MIPFLRQIADLFYKEQGANISDTCFVFPSRRAGKFFIEHLKNISNENLLAPECLTISEFFDSLCPEYEKEEKIGLLFHLYDSYKTATGSKESFNEFIGIGEIILKDFNDIDNYLVNAKYIFSNIEELARYEKEKLLSTEQIDCIRKFLNLFTENPSEYKQKTYELWCKMLQIYDHFREKLFSEGIGYDGMIHRYVVENEISDHLLPNKVVFIGFNALDGTTKALFNILKSKGIADFYWDYDFKYANISEDKENKAHYFTETNLKNYKSEFTLEKESYPETKIHAIACNSNIGQTKYVNKLLSEDLKDKAGIKSALILANESLLVPMLYSLPANKSVNISMGYPIKSSNTFNFIDFFLLLHRNYKKGKGYRTDNVKSILSHSYIIDLCKDNINKTDKIIYNNLYITNDILPQGDELLEKIFTPCEHKDLLIRLLDVLDFLGDKINIDIEKECMSQAYIAINRVKSLLERYQDITIDSITVYRIMMSILKTVNLSFIGEPLSGLQMMGMLETRCIDFDNIIITSFNEGVFPKSDIGTSLIPYSIRKPYGLPTTDHQDAIFSYNFYRLIKRASNVWLIYDTRNDSEGSSGEISRFVKQLEYLYNVKIKNISVSNSTKVSEVKEIIINKSEDDITKIKNYLKKGLSPSALNTYISCPLRFYYEKIKGVYEEKQPSAIIDAAQLGSIFHLVMEQIYTPYQGKIVYKSDLVAITNNYDYIKDITQKAFTVIVYELKDFSNIGDYHYEITGENLIIFNMIIEMVRNTLFCDIKRTPFKHILEEYSTDMFYTTANGKEVKIKGIIDRIDEKEDKIQLIDYKTTRLKEIKATEVEKIDILENFFDNDNNHSANDKKYVKEILQMCFYNLLYAEKAGGKKIETYLYLARMSYDTENFLDNTKVVLPEDWESTFRANLDRIIDDLLDENKPITQSKEPKNLNCKLCPFLPICGKVVKE